MVQINIAARHGQLSDSSREKIVAKVEKLGRYFDRLAHVDVTVDLEHEGAPEVEILVRTESKHDFAAKDSSANLMTSVETVVHKVEQQLKKYKTRLQDRRGPGTGLASAEIQEANFSGDEDSGEAGPG